MTVLDDAPWLTVAEYRELLGLPPRALVAANDAVRLDALGRRWDPRRHPRGRDGRFIEVGGLVKFFESLNGPNVAGSGTVTRIDGDNIHVHITHHNTNPALNGTTVVFNKRQIATIPPGEVRLDRRGNVHPDDRELPDKRGKLVRVGDTVKVGDKTGKVTRVDDNSGRIVVRNSDGLHIMRRVETVERLDAPNDNRQAAPAARLDAPGPAPAPAPTPRNPTPRGNATPNAVPGLEPVPAGGGVAAARARLRNGARQRLHDHGVPPEQHDALVHDLTRPEGPATPLGMAIAEHDNAQREHGLHDAALQRHQGELDRVNGRLAERGAGQGGVLQGVRDRLQRELPAHQERANASRERLTRARAQLDSHLGRDQQVPRNTAERAAFNFPDESPLQPAALERLLELRGFEERNSIAARHLNDPTAVQDIKNDRAYGRMRMEHDRALRQVLPSAREKKVVSDWRKLQATLDQVAAHPPARLDTPPARSAPNPTPRDAHTPFIAPVRDRALYEQELRAATDATQVDVIEQQIEADPHLSEADKHHLAGVVNELRDRGPANADPSVAPAPPAPAPPAPAERAPLMQPGVRGRGQFANAVLPNHYGEQLRVGVVVRTRDGLTGYVARVHPPSNRVVIKNDRGLEVMRDARLVRVQYADAAPNPPAAPATPAPAPQAPPAGVDLPNAGVQAQAIVDMHAAGARLGFPLEPEVGAARQDLQAAVDAANSNNPIGFKSKVESAIRNYDAALHRGIRHTELAADVRRRRDAAQAILDDVAAGRAHVGDPNHDHALNLNLGDLRELRALIPNRLRGIPGTGEARVMLRNAGYALDDALDTGRDSASRQLALRRARRNLQRAIDQGQPGVRDLLTRLDNLTATPPGARVGRDVRLPEPDLVRPNIERPTHPLALNSNARGEDYAQKWGIERGDEIARAARERPKLEGITAATSNADILRLAGAAFNGEYGNSGLTFKVTTATGRDRHLTVGGTVYKNGRSVGSFSRNVNDTGVYNAYFKINSAVQAGGAATEFNRHMENWYIANGIKRVRVSAGLDKGGFVWARNGFDWENPKRTAAHILNEIKPHAQGNPEAMAQIADITDRINRLDETDMNFPTPFELSQIGWKPGQGRADMWAGKQGMLGKGWTGVKELNPTARAYVQQVARGRMPDPAIKERPRPSQYGPEHVPDDIRQLSYDTLTGVGPKGSTSTIGGYSVQRLSPGSLDPAAAAGVNDTFILTSNADGRRYVIKRDTLAGEPGAQAEVAVADMLKGMNAYGASHVEVHPLDNTMIISTYAGEPEGATNYRTLARESVGVWPSNADAYVARMADPNELVRAAVLDAAIANGDRHGHNGYFVTGADGKEHLVLFDHGMAMDSRVDALNAEQLVQNQRLGYGRLLQAQLRALGPTASEGEIANAARRLLDVVNALGMPADKKQRVVDRLNEIIQDPAKYAQAMSSRSYQ